MNPQLPIVIALGGHAISPPGEEGNIDQQFMHTRQSMQPLVRLAATGVPLLVTHGNGPQVGSVIRRVELAAKELYTLPLHICVADTQAGMGYMIAQCLNNELRHQGVPRTSATLVTMVEVDPADPGFQKPTKPIGRVYPREDGERLAREHGWTLGEAKGGVRRVVASPQPKSILELETIRAILMSGTVLVAAGGGGVPVMRGADGDWQGVEAVVDKDRTAALLGAQLGAAVLVILTGVDRVALNYNTPQERWLDRLSVSEAGRLMEEGHFPPGSMGPKIEAAMRFLQGNASAGASVLITDLEHLHEALEGKAGTRVTRD